jgi:hypothetical protein
MENIDYVTLNGETGKFEKSAKARKNELGSYLTIKFFTIMILRWCTGELQYQEEKSSYTDEEENQISSFIRKFRMEQVAKSYMTDGLLVDGEIFAHFLIY